MADTIQPYELTQKAELDLEEIFDYTVNEFGIEQAISYVSDFENSFIALAVNPKLGRERTEIRKDLRSLAKSSHVIFYRIIRQRVRIIRVLHASRDVVTFFKPQK